MKILHAAEIIKGGVATVMRQLAIHQSDKSNVEELICLVPEEQAKELLPLNAQYIKTFQRSGRNFASLMSFLRSFVGHIMRHKPDIVHVHSSFAGVLARSALMVMRPFYRPKVVYCPHAFSFLMQGTEKKKKIYAFIERFLAVFTDEIICVSQYEKDEAVKYGLPKNKLKVVYNGVPVIEHDKSAYASPYQTDVTNLLFVGRFDYQKGFDILERLVKKLEGKPFHLTAVGGAVLNTDVQPLQSPQITYTGWLSSAELAPYLAHADLLIIPSRWEGFAMVPLEAMSYGLPIVASDSTSLPEVVIEGKTGRLFPLDHEEVLLDIITSTSKSAWRAMGQEARQLFLAKFTANNMTNTTDKIYSDIIS
ncbi:glycosyltransferase [Serratia sp. JUb9]|uniref:glycosyltransferase n=1 Tax=Serratia sp. JUb9 TaxID=2724469 RepID=UPI00164E3A3D|nr:glycosyltransferase [Serratia sp. JUb9]QNK31136.1 glycosyltransferase [Serratia sp. JUb9]QPT14941.1 glycosyltransferase [Serratia rubidaea]